MGIITKKDINKLISENVHLVLEKFNYEPFSDYPDTQWDNQDWGEYRDRDNNRRKMGHDSALEDFGEMDPNFQKERDELQAQISQNIKRRAKNMMVDPVTHERLNDFTRFNMNPNRLVYSDAVKGQIKDDPSKGEIILSGKSFSYGNSKLPPSTMIVNMTSALNCPSKDCPFHVKVDKDTGKIEFNGCYATSGENRYPGLELRNLRNQESFKRMSLRDIVKLLDFYIIHAPHRIHNIRLHEDGDFPNPKSVELCDKIAGRLYQKFGITTVAYTYADRRGFDEAFANTKNLIINSSTDRLKNVDRYHFARSEEYLEGIDKSKGIHEWKNPNTKEWEKYYFCDCDCRKCNFCYNTREENGEDKPTQHTGPEEKAIVYTIFRKPGQKKDDDKEIKKVKGVKIRKQPKQ